MAIYSEQGDPVLARMIHQTRLATWVIQTLGRALGVFLGLPMLGGIISTLTGEIGWVWAGAVAGVVGPVIYLTGVAAPMPKQDVVDLVLGEQDGSPVGE